VPLEAGSSAFALEKSKISECDVILQCQKTLDAKVFGFNTDKSCFVSFNLKKALLDDLVCTQGEIT
jgi:hypothetical protein